MSMATSTNSPMMGGLPSLQFANNQGQCGYMGVGNGAGSSGGVSLVQMGRINGGNTATPGKWCWQVAIIDRTSSRYLCGGVLLDAQTVLTVGHCLEGFTASNQNNLMIRLGDFDLTSNSENPAAVDLGVVNIIRAPDYRIDIPPRSDLAILKLSGPAPRQSNICFVCLPGPGSDFTGQLCTVTGWGQTTGGAYATQLQEISNLQVIGQQNCAQAYRYPPYRFENYICAGGAGQDTCTGDGGSPLVCQVGNQFYLAGVTVFGTFCGTQNIPSAFADVTKYLTSFILPNMGSSGAVFG